MTKAMMPKIILEALFAGFSAVRAEASVVLFLTGTLQYLHNNQSSSTLSLQFEQILNAISFTPQSHEI